MTWKPGQSGNPGGRPSAVPAVAKKILAETRNGEELVEILLKAARGQHTQLCDEKSIRWAISELLDRCLGRAPQAIEVSTGASALPLPDMRGLSLDELRRLAVGEPEAVPASEAAGGEVPPGSVH